MTRDEAEALIGQAGRLAPGDDFPLLEAAVACAIHDDPARDPQVVRDLAAVGVERLTARLRRESQEEALAETMSGDLRLSGDLFTYDDPDNADIIAVAERRKGLPVTLGILYLHVAKLGGLNVKGVDFPGHFLLRIDTPEGPLALDPFSEGRVVLPSELTRRALHAGLTPNVADRLDLLMAPAADRAVLIRLQNNIFARAAAARDYGRAERAALRRALLDPQDHRPWLDVASAREGQGALAGALEALARAGELDHGAALAARVQRERVRLRLN